MKNTTVLYLVAAAGLYYYFMNRRKKIGIAAISCRSAAKKARQMVADIVDNTTFLPDDTTFKRQYENDQKNCR